MKISEKIIQVLKDAGLEDKVGGSYRSCKHRCGINPFEVSVQPEYSPVDGDHIVTVTPTSVQSYTVRIPYNYSDWCMRTSRDYETPEEMVKIVKSIIEKPKGCWT